MLKHSIQAVDIALRHLRHTPEWRNADIVTDEVTRLREELAAAKAALNAAYAYLIPEVDRGPARREWCKTLREVEAIIGPGEVHHLLQYENR